MTSPVKEPSLLSQPHSSSASPSSALRGGASRISIDLLEVTNKEHQSFCQTSSLVSPLKKRRLTRIESDKEPFSEDCPMEGTLFHPDGTTYKGLLKESKPHGKGILTFSNGDFFEGEFLNGKFHGKGKLFSQTGILFYEGIWKNNQFLYGKGRMEKGYYKGEWQNEVPNGYGVFDFFNGSIFTGTFTNGQMASGKLIYQDLTTYEGTFENELPQGLGKVTYSNGDHYIGEFVSGKFHGKGQMISARGEILYDGDWQTNSPHGHGSGKVENGHYTGEWCNGTPNGKGVLIHSNETRHEGQFASGQMIFGKIFDQDKKIYEGALQNEKFHGPGELACSNGNFYQGEFFSGKFHGQGRITSAQGDLIYEGEWQNDLPHGKGSGKTENDTYYEGEWQGGLPNGQGIMSLPNGKRNEGQFTNGRLTLGKVTYENGMIYEGAMKDGKPHGFGKAFDSANLLRYSGDWRNGVCHGNGMGFLATGEFGIGTFQDGAFILQKKKRNPTWREEIFRGPWSQAQGPSSEGPF